MLSPGTLKTGTPGGGVAVLAALRAGGTPEDDTTTQQRQFLAESLRPRVRQV